MMRCPYCFQVIDDDSRQCAHCGSRLPEELFTGEAQRPAAARDLPQADAPFPLSSRQLIASLGGAIILLACIFGSLIGLARPELLPRSLVAAAPFLTTPTTVPTRQATRASLVTATPFPTERSCSRRAEFCLTFPGDWLVIDQGLPGWQRKADALAEQYGWLPTLFDVQEVPRVPRLRAVSPALVAPADGRIARLTAGETGTVTSTLALDQIENLIQDDPEAIIQVVGPPLQPEANVRRFTRERLGPYEALLIELEADAQVQDESVPARARIYLFPANERLYALSYLADETTILERRELFEQIVESFEIEE